MLRILWCVDDEIHILPLRRRIGHCESQPRTIQNFLPVRRVMHPKADVGSCRNQFPGSKRTVIFKLRSRHVTELDRRVSSGLSAVTSSLTEWFPVLWKFISA